VNIGLNVFLDGMKYGWQNTGEAALQSKSMRFLGYSADVHKINLGERVCG